VGDVLAAEYRSQATGEVIGQKSFLYDGDTLDTYLQDAFLWWRGEREARGVDIEDAYKCRICEFAEGCQWRESKIEEAVQNHRLLRRRTQGSHELK
jgi:exonuclease V